MTIETMKLFCKITEAYKNSKFSGHLSIFNTVLATPSELSTGNLIYSCKYLTNEFDKNIPYCADSLRETLCLGNLASTATKPIEDLPVAPFYYAADTTRTIAIGVDRFIECYKTMKHHISHDDTKKYLQGGFISKEDMLITTNGFSLAYTPVYSSGDSENEVILPVETLNLLERICKFDKTLKNPDCRIKIDINNDNHKLVKINVGKWEIISMVLQGIFPDYRCVMPSNTPSERISFDAQTFVKDLKKLEPLAKKCTYVVRINPNNTLSVRAPYPAAIQEKIKKDMDFKPEPMPYTSIESNFINTMEKSMAFNIRILLYCLKNFKGPIQITGKDELSPWVFEHDGITQIIMPVRIDYI